MSASAASSSPKTVSRQGPRLWLERLRLTNFRNYAALSLELDPRFVVLTGPNGAGKTNLLEAVSLLAPGRGLGRARLADLTRHGAGSGWAVAARVHAPGGPVEIGTGFEGGDESAGRAVRIEGKSARGPAALAEHVRLVWLTPAMDGLFTGPAGERRRFLDRLIQTLEPGYRASVARFERAMRQRNRLLETGEAAPALYDGLETQLAETGVAMAATRVAWVARLAETAAGGREEGGPFPWATLALEGQLEERLAHEAAVEVEDEYRRALRDARPRDRAAKRTLEGPHRADLLVGHGPKGVPAPDCSTGEQKALLIGLVLAHARLVKQRNAGTAPLVLLDEIVAHLDAARREGLFAALAALDAQSWMSGTERAHFEPLGERARFLSVENGSIGS